jgi:quercetin 2,3-dioxygenase
VSGPVSTRDVPTDGDDETHDPTELEIVESREAKVGAIRVRRALPQRGRRTVGPWCFLDHVGPTDVANDGLGIAPHPHIGLQTVTWLLSGEALHRDSLGSEQVIRPGQLNLMTAGHGVAHSEEGTGRHIGEVHGVQLWVAQPGPTRDGPPAFEHHAELPMVDLVGGEATLLVGVFGGSESPARRDTEHMGIDLVVRGEASIPLNPSFEHALVVVSGRVEAERRTLEPGRLMYLGPGRDHLGLDTSAPARALLVGGRRYEDRIHMWWNYVAASREEISAAHRDWTARSERFGRVDSPLPPIDVGPPPWQ